MSNMMNDYYTDVVSSENIYADPAPGKGAPAIYADPAPGKGAPAIYADPAPGKGTPAIYADPAALDATITYIGVSEQSTVDVIFQI